MTKKTIKPEEKIEREYVIPLRARYKHVSLNKKTPKAIKTVKEFLAKHMQIRDKDLNKIKLDKFVNEYLWARGIKNPPHKIKVKATRENGIVNVSLVEYPTKLKFKKTREEKEKKEALAIVEKKKTMMQKMKEGGTTKTKESSTEKSKDENKDGVENKKEESEKKSSVVEAGEKTEKAMAKGAKHMTKAKSPKQEKNEKAGYNKGSRGQ